MASKERELLKRVLEADDGDSEFYIDGKLEWDIKELLAQPEQEQEQEPVAWMWTNNDGCTFFENSGNPDHNWIPLYTSPPTREPLSTKQAEDLWETFNFKSALPYYIFDEICLAVEQYHGIGVDDVQML